MDNLTEMRIHTLVHNNPEFSNNLRQWFSFAHSATQNLIYWLLQKNMAVLHGKFILVLKHMLLVLTRELEV